MGDTEPKKKTNIRSSPKTETAVNNSLSRKMFTIVLLVAVATGFLLALIQLLFEYQSQKELIQQEANSTLAMMQEPASRAAFHLDETLAEEVLDGLFQNPSVASASITLDTDPTFVTRSRPLIRSNDRTFEDLLFGRSQDFSINLEVPENASASIFSGSLNITLDTYPAARAFVDKAVVVVLSGLVRAAILALALYWVYHYLLARPLSQIIDSLSNIDPEHPHRHSIKPPSGHEDDELGEWVIRTNQLLDSIEQQQLKRAEAEAQADRLIQYDHLTDLPNRSYFYHRLRHAIYRARKHDQMVAVLYCGLDDFSQVNEKHGFQSGDQTLISISQRLQNRLQSANSIARLGSDHFAILFDDIEQPYDAATLAQITLKMLSVPFSMNGEELIVHTSIGIAFFPNDANNAEEVVQKAGKAMQFAKRSGGNQYQFYEADVDIAIRQRREMEQELKLAIQKETLEVFYQPVVNLVTEDVVAAEALLRWNHHKFGPVAPDVFIPLAESSQLIVPLGNWVLNKACRQLRQWREDYGRSEMQIAVNLSPVQIKQLNLLQVVKHALEANRLPPDALILEITETAVVEQFEPTVKALEELRNLGVKIALDDFGTGYSSLHYLKQLPLDKVKIDKSFVHGLPDSEDDKEIVRAIIQLGESMRLGVVAEGVETREQHYYLQGSTCLEGQGFYYSRPMSPRKLSNLLTDERGIRAANN